VTDLKKLYLDMRSALARAVGKIVPLHEVEDVVQETYVRLCLVDSEREIKHARSFVYRTAINLARDSVKSAYSRLKDEDSDESLLSADHDDAVLRRVVSDEEFSRFCRAIRRLATQPRRAFVLRRVYGYSQKEIAEIMGLSEKTVEKHISAGLKKCTQAMQRSNGTDPRSAGKRLKPSE